MEKERIALEFIRLILSIHTGLIIMGVIEVFADRIDLHQRIMGIVVSTTIMVFMFFFGSQWMGWDYSHVLKHHTLIMFKLGALCLMVSLMATAFFGVLKIIQLHKLSLFVLGPLWFGGVLSCWMLF